MKLIQKVYLLLFVILCLGFVAFFSGDFKKDHNQVEQAEKSDTLKEGYYFGQYKGADAILSVAEDKTLYVMQSSISSPITDVTQFSNPVRILNEESKDSGFQIFRFAVDVKKEYLYASFEIGPDEKRLNKIVKINLKTLEKTEIHSHVIGDETYSEKGALFIENIQGDWLVLSLSSCVNCEGSFVASVILNTVTGQEKYLGVVGNVKIEGDTLSYQKLVRENIPCTDEDIRTDDFGFCDHKTKTRSVLNPGGVMMKEKISALMIKK